MPAGVQEPLLLRGKMFVDCLVDLLVLGKFAGLSFRPDLVSVDPDLEDSPIVGHETELFDLELILRQKVLGQAHGLRFILSFSAVLNR